MSEYLRVMRRADRAAHDVAQLHLPEFRGDGPEFAIDGA